MKEAAKWIVLLYLRFFAKIALFLHKPTVIGIAGSVGKSSTRNALFAILKDHFPSKMIGNSETGIPLGILGITPHGFTPFHWFLMLIATPFGINFLKGTTYLIAEMGIDDPYPPKNMEYLLTIIKPDIAVSLNISATHTMQFEKLLNKKEGHGTDLDFILQQMAEDDTKIITKSGCKIGIYNADDFYISKQITAFKQKGSSTTLLPFGKQKQNAISFADYHVSTEGTLFGFEISNDKKTATLFINFPKFLLPRVYEEVFAASILAALQTSLSIDQIQKSLENNFTLPKGRGSIFEGIHDSLIIDSSYNASRNAIEAFLDLAQILKRQSKRPFVFVMGDMRELGEAAKVEHENVARKILETVDYLYCVGPLTREFVVPSVSRSARKIKEIQWFENSQKAGQCLQKNLPKNALVLVKGSQNTIFLEEAVKYLLKNKSDNKNLCRQEEYWLKIKQPILS